MERVLEVEGAEGIVAERRRVESTEDIKGSIP
jgi:hypothetical protein